MLFDIDTYFDDAPVRCIAVCPFCPDTEEGPTILNFRPQDEDIKCGECRRTFRLMTRKISGVTKQVPLSSDDDAGRRVRYRIMTEAPGGRQSMHSFIAKPGAKLLHGQWATMLWHNSQFMGIANQDEEVFVPSRNKNEKQSAYHPATTCVFVVTALLAALFMHDAAIELADMLTEASLVAQIVAGVVAITLGIPFIKWLVKPIRVKASN